MKKTILMTIFAFAAMNASAASTASDVYLNIPAELPAGPRTSARLEFQSHESLIELPGWDGVRKGVGSVVNNRIFEGAGFEAMAPGLYKLPIIASAWDTVIFSHGSFSAAGEHEKFFAGLPVSRLKISTFSSSRTVTLFKVPTHNYVEIKWDGERLGFNTATKDPATLGAATLLP